MVSRSLNVKLALPVLLQLFLIFQGNGEMFDFTDTWQEFAACFFTIVCELDEGFTIHPPMTLSSYEMIEHIHDLVLEVIPVKVSFTADDIITETFWNATVKDLACNLTDAERKKAVNEYGARIMKYQSEICTNPLKKEVCEKSENTASGYMGIFQKKVRKGQCKGEGILLSN